MAVMLVLLLLVAAMSSETHAPPLSLPPGRWVRSVAVTFDKPPAVLVPNASRTFYTPSLKGADFIVKDETETAVTFRGYWRG